MRALSTTDPPNFRIISAKAGLATLDALRIIESREKREDRRHFVQRGELRRTNLTK